MTKKRDLEEKLGWLGAYGVATGAALIILMVYISLGRNPVDAAYPLLAMQMIILGIMIYLKIKIKRLK